MWAANSTLALLFSSFSFLSSEPEPVQILAKTSQGVLEGTEAVSRNERTYYNFVGIPYALPPVHELRFKPPILWNENWEGIRNAKEYGPKCIQYHLIGKYYMGKEDCLFLNIYTHKFQREEEDLIAKDELKPVIVYFHGGLWMQGSSEFYQPKFFMDEDVVFITISYRIGALGFLSLENDDISGNQGLKDQVAGLKWVKNNIHHFGGDSNSVTIVGESAGSVAVHFHILSPMSTGLFHRAISQSGTSLVSWGSRDNPFEQAKYYAHKLNCSSESKIELAICLRKLDVKEIGNVQRLAASILHHKHALFGPTIEAKAVPRSTTEKFITEKPEDIIKSGKFNKVPWIVGANSEEGLIYAAPMVRNETVRKELNANWTHWIPIIFRFDEEPEKERIAKSIREYYFSNLSTELSMETLPNLTKFLTDRSFFEGLHHSLNLHRGHHPIYPYIYSYRGTFSFGKVLVGLTYNLPVLADVLVTTSWRWFSTNVLRSKEIDYGTSHGDELPLMFNLPFQNELDEGAVDYQMSKTLIKMWTSFARDGVPPEIQGIRWPSLPETESTGQPIQFLNIDKEFKIIDEPFFPRADFWKSLNLLPCKISKADTSAENKTNSIA